MKYRGESTVTMSKRIILILVLAVSLMGQNIQLHYDLAEDRQYPVTFVEMFSPDNMGSTYWFVTMEYNNGGMSLAYWEIARHFTLPVQNLSATVQYNDGVANFGSLGYAWLAGISYYFQIGEIGLPVDIMYRAAQGAQSADFQITTYWGIPFLNEKLSFVGYFDLWSQDSGQDEKMLVVLTEPQIWYKLGESLSVGTEFELSHNFLFGETGLQLRPTLGARWEF